MSIEEKFNQAKGSFKEGFGKLTGDKKLETKEPKSKKRTNLILIYKIVVNDCAKIMFFI